MSFTGERTSSDGGLLLLREVNRQTGLILLREVNRQTGLIKHISNCITNNRDQRYIDRSIEELLSQRAY